MPLAQTDHSTVIQACLDQLRQGDDSARAALLECACERLTRLARRMLRGFPRVQRWEQTDDVLQNALLRLRRALEKTSPESVRSFVNLAAVQIRRELIDLARHYDGPDRDGGAPRKLDAGGWLARIARRSGSPPPTRMIPIASRRGAGSTVASNP